MNKNEAATRLGVSMRAVERYVSAGKLAARYIKGKTGQVLDLEEEEVERFKIEQEAPVEKAPTGGSTSRDESRQAVTTLPLDRVSAAIRAEQGRGEEVELDEDQVRPPQGPTSPTTALARVDAPSLQGARALLEASPGFYLLVQALRDAVISEAATKSDNRTLSVPVEAKPLLTLAECCALTGLSRGLIKGAIDAEQLPARQMGRAWRVRRDELDKWLKTV